MTHSLTPYDHMQNAVNIVPQSQHSTNKIAATIFGKLPNNTYFSQSCVNYWPDVIINTIGRDQKIGNSSGSIHAETACLLAAPKTQGLSVAITDPFCPNCAKNMAEAGIKNIFIDHKGFQKDFAIRRGDSFKTMSMQICVKAGINVYELHRKDQKIIPIYQAPSDFKADIDSPVTTIPVDKPTYDNFTNIISHAIDIHHGRKFAVAFAKNATGQTIAFYVRTHPSPGYLTQKDKDDVSNPVGKYSYFLEPLNRILMNAPRLGHTLIDGYIFVSRVPTAREQVNFIGAGLTSLIVGDIKTSRDKYGIQAMNQLRNANIIKYKSHL